jgi:hypothetical protein
MFKTHDDVIRKTNNWAHREFDKDLQFNSEIWEIALRNRVVHTGHFYRSGSGLLETLGYTELTGLQTALHKSCPDYFEFSQLQVSKMERRFASFVVTDAIRKSRIENEDYRFSKYFFVMILFMLSRVGHFFKRTVGLLNRAL